MRDQNAAALLAKVMGWEDLDAVPQVLPNLQLLADFKYDHLKETGVALNGAHEGSAGAAGSPTSAHEPVDSAHDTPAGRDGWLHASRGRPAGADEPPAGANEPPADASDVVSSGDAAHALVSQQEPEGQLRMSLRKYSPGS